MPKKSLLLTLYLLLMGCASSYTDNKSYFWNMNTKDADIVNARSFSYSLGPSINCQQRYICMNPDRDLVSRFAKRENTKEDGEYLARRFMEEYNEKNKTNFNVLVRYDLALDTLESSKGQLAASIRGILLEVK